MKAISSTIAHNLNPSTFSYRTKLKLALITSISSVAIGIFTSLPLVIVAGVLTGTYAAYKTFTHIHALEKHQTQLQREYQQIKKQNIELEEDQKRKELNEELRDIYVEYRGKWVELSIKQRLARLGSQSPETAPPSPPCHGGLQSGLPQIVAINSSDLNANTDVLYLTDPLSRLTSKIQDLLHTLITNNTLSRKLSTGQKKCIEHEMEQIYNQLDEEHLKIQLAFAREMPKLSAERTIGALGSQSQETSWPPCDNTPQSLAPQIAAIKSSEPNSKLGQEKLSPSSSGQSPHVQLNLTSAGALKTLEQSTDLNANHVTPKTATQDSSSLRQSFYAQQTESPTQALSFDSPPQNLASKSSPLLSRTSSNTKITPPPSNNTTTSASPIAPGIASPSSNHFRAGILRPRPRALTQTDRKDAGLPGTEPSSAQKGTKSGQKSATPDGRFPTRVSTPSSLTTSSRKSHN